VLTRTTLGLHQRVANKHAAPERAVPVMLFWDRYFEINSGTIYV
jgi:hypothetical protein